MRYLNYPGCSFKGTGRSYEESMTAVFRKLNIEFEDIDDWNCCGSVAGLAMDKYKTYAIAARNLALAERQAGVKNGEKVQVLSPCNACLQILLKAIHCLREDAVNGSRIRNALKAINLDYNDRVEIRHPLDVLVCDIGYNKIAEFVVNPLKELKVACYYGCQMVRPYIEFDDANEPKSMEKLMQILGAETVEWAQKTKCCGGSLTGTLCCGGSVMSPMDEVGLQMCYQVLKDAQHHDVDVVAVTCPLCQLNLEGYQDRMRKMYNDDIDMPVVCFTQLIGKAMGISDSELGMSRLFVPMRKKAGVN